MRYTPSEFRDALGITQETLRHWRKVIPVFANRRGYTPVFAVEDLILGGIIKRLRDSTGVSASHLANISMNIKQFCTVTSIDLMRKSTLVLDMDNSTCSFLNDESYIDQSGVKIIIPLLPILTEISLHKGALNTNYEKCFHEVSVA